jgi:hypothetical protein
VAPESIGRHDDWITHRHSDCKTAGMRESTEPQRPAITSVTIPPNKVTKPLKVLPPPVEDEEDDSVICRGID